MTVNRRRFLQLGTLAGASLLVPRFLNSFTENNVSSNRKLIVIQLSGGNDGLNTVIPYRNDIYYNSRPLISISPNHALKLSDEAGLHPSLRGIKNLYDEGYVSVVNSVGYPQPNRSHFKSMDIWHSGNTGQADTGWLGRYLDHTSGKAKGVELDETVSLVMRGRSREGYASGNYAHQKHHPGSRYLYSTEYPNTVLGSRMKAISSLLKSNPGTQVLYASHGSFDTHVDQADHHSRLLMELDESLTVLVSDLKESNLFNDVMIVVFSEFGRRVMQNISKGTDHGAANNMFLISGGLKQPGIYNDMPDLSDLDDGDLKYKVDFREIYATILDKWLEADASLILGKEYIQHNFI